MRSRWLALLGACAVSAAAAAVSSPSKPAPPGMVWIPGGEFWMGSDDFADAQPWHRVHVDGFWMDESEVTNEQFEHFVRATGYVTVAERKPKPSEFPGVPEEKLVAGSAVFTPPASPVPSDQPYSWWQYLAGANWRHPTGPNSDLTGKAKHPVVHIAYEDAVTYCEWAGKRLPTEAEFEYAARGGLERARYAWGNEFQPGGKWMANTFQGHFPDSNTRADGFAGTAPVRSFPANPYGLYDIAGNVWEWCSDWYHAEAYAAIRDSVDRNPRGPTDSFDPDEVGVPKRVNRGGSFLCTDQYCARYEPGGRGKADPGTSTNHLGFRCVKSAVPHK